MSSLPLVRLCGYLLGFGLPFVPTCVLAQDQSPSNLPPGYYIYLGQRPGKVAPKGFTVNGDGSLIWQNNKRPLDPAAVDATQDTGATSGPQQVNGSPNTPIPMARPAIPGEENMESNEYPMIKWKPKPLVEIPGAFAQLTTTFESGQAKYKCILFQARGPVELQLEFADANGFKLHDFKIYRSDFHVIPGTQLLEARGDISYFYERDYRRAKDISVKCVQGY